MAEPEAGVGSSIGAVKGDHGLEVGEGRARGTDVPAAVLGLSVAVEDVVLRSVALAAWYKYGCFRSQVLWLCPRRGSVRWGASVRGGRGDMYGVGFLHLALAKEVSSFTWRRHTQPPASTPLLAQERHLVADALVRAEVASSVVVAEVQVGAAAVANRLNRPARHAAEVCLF